MLCEFVNVNFSNNRPIFTKYSIQGGTRWRVWLRHCATSRKVAGSIPDGVIRIFHSLNPPGRTQPLTEMSTWDISCVCVGGGGPMHRANNLAIFMWRLCRKFGSLNSWSPKGSTRPLYLQLGKVQWLTQFLRRIQTKKWQPWEFFCTFQCRTVG
jgi:hypothetical protein